MFVLHLEQAVSCLTIIYVKSLLMESCNDAQLVLMHHLVNGLKKVSSYTLTNISNTSKTYSHTWMHMYNAMLDSFLSQRSCHVGLLVSDWMLNKRVHDLVLLSHKGSAAGKQQGDLGWKKLLWGQDMGEGGGMWMKACSDCKQMGKIQQVPFCENSQETEGDEVGTLWLQLLERKKNTKTISGGEKWNSQTCALSQKLQKLRHTQTPSCFTALWH